MDSLLVVRDSYGMKKDQSHSPAGPGALRTFTAKSLSFKIFWRAFPLLYAGFYVLVAGAVLWA